MRDLGLRSWSRAVFLSSAAAFCLLLTASSLLPSGGQARGQDGAREELLEVASAREVRRHQTAPAELKVVSYNIRYRVGEDLQELIGLLRADPEIGGASIIGLQEVDRNKKRTGNTNTARLIADALGMHYAWAAPPDTNGDGEEETGVTLLSPFPLTDVERIVLPHEGPDKRRRVAVGATVNVGGTPVRAYSVHAETRMSTGKKVEHWRAVLDDLKRFPEIRHAVVLGDLNTIKGSAVRAARRLFTGAGFHTPFPDDRSTWKTFIIELKLDWVWLRGFDVGEFGIDKKVGLSDHWPMWVKVKIGKKKGAPNTTESSAAAGGSR